ncbi:hypothetical protein ACW7BC_30440 [Azospirillum argentinense]
MAAYYNEFDPGAAAWLRELIAEGHIAPGDVDTRSIADVQPDDLTRLIEFTFNIDQQYLLAFSAGRMDAFTADGVPAGSIDGCPWTPTDVQAMTWVQSGDTVFIACRSWRPRVLTRTDVAAWALEAWEADKGVGGALLQPYAKFAPAPSTIKPSGRVGYVNIVASDPSFAAGHVWQMVRYAGCEIVITEVHNPWSATGMPMQVLPPSVRIALNTVAPFRVPAPTCC